MKAINLTLLTVMAFATAGCSSVNRCKAPELDLPATMAAGASTDTVTIADMEWWKFYGDSTLCNIISRSLDKNRDRKSVV